MKHCILFPFLSHLNVIMWSNWYKTAARGELLMYFLLFAIKNRYKISLYKYTREMQHVVNPTPYRASYCSGVTNIWKDRIIQRDDALTCTPRMQLEQLSYKDDLTTERIATTTAARSLVSPQVMNRSSEAGLRPLSFLNIHPVKVHRFEFYCKHSQVSSECFSPKQTERLM